MKYLPIEANPVDACRWLHNDFRAVGEFLTMLSMHNLAYCFDSESLDDWAVEIHVVVDGRVDVVIENDKWLLIHANGTLETMAHDAFIKSYRIA